MEVRRPRNTVQRAAATRRDQTPAGGLARAFGEARHQIYKLSCKYVDIRYRRMYSLAEQCFDTSAATLVS